MVKCLFIGTNGKEIIMEMGVLAALFILFCAVIGNRSEESATERRPAPEPPSERARLAMGCIGILAIGVCMAFLLKSGWEQEQRWAETRQRDEERFARWEEEKSELFIGREIPEHNGWEALILCTIKTKGHEDERWWFGSGCFVERPKEGMAYILTKQDERWRWIPKENQ